MESKREIINNCIFKSKNIENVYSSRNVLIEKFEKDANYDPKIEEKNKRIKKKINIYIIFFLIIIDQSKTIIITTLLNLFLLIYNFIDKPTLVSSYNFIVFYNLQKLDLNNQIDCKILYSKFINLNNVENIITDYCNSQIILDLKYFNLNNFFFNGNNYLIIIIITVLWIIEIISLRLLIIKLYKVKTFIIIINFVFNLFKTIFYLILIIQLIRIQIFNTTNYENNIFIICLIFSFLFLLVSILILLTYNFMISIFLYFFYFINIDILFYSFSNSIDNNENIYDSGLKFFFILYLVYSIFLFGINLIIFILKIFKKYKKNIFIYFNLYVILIILFNIKFYFIFEKNKIIIKYHYIFEIFEILISIIYFLLFFLNKKYYKILIKNKKEKYQQNLNKTNFIVVDFPKILVL